jgi:sarcosine oxidase
MKYDVVVVGLGAVGSASAYHLAKRGMRVLGIDRYAPPHTHGSSHGGTRITRLAIGEGEQYTPLAMRSHELWRAIEDETGADLLCTNGGLFISSDDKLSKTHVDGFFANTVAAARKYGIAHELLDARAIRRRYPQFAVAESEYGYFEPSAGFVRPEPCIHAQLQLARKYGAELHTGETVLAFEPAESSVRVVTDHGRYEADKLILAAGPWLPDLVAPSLAGHFKIYRQVQLWFSPHGNVTAYRPDRFPVFIWELRKVKQGIYGFPAIDGATGGIKVASESFDITTHPESVERRIAPAEIRKTYESLVAPYFPGVSGECVKATVCLYTVTSDFGFVIDTHPQSARVIVASPCSGHGFKHSPAVGEALSAWAISGQIPRVLNAFSLARFGQREEDDLFSQGISNPPIIA